MTLRRWILWFVACGVGGALLDQLHTQLGVLSYRQPFFLGQAWWVAPNFGIGGVIFLAIARVMAHRTPKSSDRDILINVAIVGGAYLASCFSFGHGWALLGGFLVVWSLLIARSSAPKPTALYSLIISALGCSYEITVTSTGAYWFHHPDVLTVPAWLPGLYLIGGPAGMMIAQRLSRGLS